MKKILEPIKVQHELYKCCTQWKERVGQNTATKVETGYAAINAKLCSIIHQKIANFAHLYPWFSNMSTHFAVAHNKFLSIFDINS
jgi:hypothetical protein